MDSSTYDDNDSGVQDTVLPSATKKQYGSYTDGMTNSYFRFRVGIAVGVIGHSLWIVNKQDGS